MCTKQDFNFTVLGRTLILGFSHQQDERSLNFIRVLRTEINKQFHQQLEDSTTTFNSINLFFKEAFQLEQIKPELLNIIATLDFKNTNPTTLWKLPICVAEDYTTDVQEFFIGDQKKVNAYIDRFLSLEFHLVFYGFLPGFPYLGGLPQQWLFLGKLLQVARLLEAVWLLVETRLEFILKTALEVGMLWVIVLSP